MLAKLLLGVSHIRVTCCLDGKVAVVNVLSKNT